MESLTAKQIILELLRVAPAPIAVSDLVVIGGWFGLQENAVRVTLARLKQRSLVCATAGQYTLDPSGVGVSDWVESWREGDDRLIPWADSWLCALLPKGGSATHRRGTARALGRYGYAPALTNLWVRPANLRADNDQLADTLTLVGLPNDVVLFQGSHFPTALVESWRASLWPTENLIAGLEKALMAVQASNTQLDKPEGFKTLVTAFLVGSRALNQLTQDPLLPDQICDGAPRRALTQAMLRYDERGRELWNTETVSALISQSKQMPSNTSIERSTHEH